MNVVYKFIINVDNPELWIHEKSKVLKVDFQGDDLCLWAEVDTENNMVVRNFHVFGTGQKIPYNMGVDFEYVDTAFIGNLVFHIYERLGL